MYSTQLNMYYTGQVAGFVSLVALSICLSLIHILSKNERNSQVRVSVGRKETGTTKKFIFVLYKPIYDKRNVDGLIITFYIFSLSSETAT